MSQKKKRRRRSQWERETVGQKVRGQMVKKAWAKGLSAGGSDGCMGSRQSGKLIVRTWVGLLMGERGRKWTMEVQRVKVKLGVRPVRIPANNLINSAV